MVTIELEKPLKSSGARGGWKAGLLWEVFHVGPGICRSELESCCWTEVQTLSFLSSAMLQCLVDRVPVSLSGCSIAAPTEQMVQRGA